MTLPASGAISMSQVNTELGYSSTATISLNDSAVRTLAGVSSGAISLDNLHGKSNSFSFTISSNQTNANLRSLAVAAGWNQSSAVVATISGGVYISSNSTGTPALTVNGSFPGGVSLTNNGIIVGMGGAGGNGGPGSWPYTPASGSGGGTALSVSTGITINNAGTIAGGGGGGGGGSGAAYSVNKTDTFYLGGGGGGGGQSSAAANSSGGSGGYGGSGSYIFAGGSGGAGTVSSAGGGGSRAQVGSYYAANGGGGGGWGASGSSGGSSATGGGGGGSGGNAVSGNGNITWTATGTRLGGIS